MISVCTLFAHFPFHQNVLSKMLDLHWSKWSVNAVRDNCQGNFNEIRRGFSRQASLGQVVRDGNSDHLQNAFGFIRHVSLRLHRTSIIDEIGLFARVACVHYLPDLANSCCHCEVLVCPNVGKIQFALRQTKQLFLAG